MDEFLGTIKLFAGHFAPQHWALCDGRVLPIAQYTALFSILGTTYGGDGQTTFALPDLRGRVPVGMGTGPGLAPRELGDAENGTAPATGHPDPNPGNGGRPPTAATLPSLALTYIICTEGTFPSRQ